MSEEVIGIYCQECFEKAATMQAEDGTYLCDDCWREKEESK